MKLIFVISFFILLNNCSFDNKTGLWDNEKITESKKNIIFKDFKKTSVKENYFNKIIPLKKNSVLNIPKPVNNLNWTDIFYKYDNNLVNFSYNNLKTISFKSKKISKNTIESRKLYIDGNLIVTDKKGNLIVFSLEDKKIISKFNFYKKRFKKVNKELNIITEKDIIYIADNIGYVYAYNYKANNIIWAKNYKIPFSSNLKIFKNKLVVSNHNNNLYILDKNTGNLLKLIPTEETSIKNQFINNLSINENGKLFFLNSFGTLYSIDLNNLVINWFNNINQSLDFLPSNLFFGSKIVNSDREVIISSSSKTYLIDIETGSILNRLNFSTALKPIIINDIIFFITKNNFLIALNLTTKQIIYSYDLAQIEDISTKFLKKDIYKDIMILDNKIFVFLKNSRILEFSIKGEFLELSKLPSKIYSSPISIENSILYLNYQNKLIILN